MAMEQQGGEIKDFAYTELVPKEAGSVLDDEFKVFMVQVKSDTEIGRALHNDPLTVLRENAPDMGLEGDDVRAQVLRVNAERPANPVRRSEVWMVFPGSTTAVGVQYKYKDES